MIHFSKKLLLKRPQGCFSFFPRYAFTTQEPAPAAEEKTEEVEDELSIPEIKIKSKKKKMGIPPPDAAFQIKDVDEISPKDFPKIFIYSHEGESDTERGNFPEFQLGEPTEEEILKNAKMATKKKFKIKMINPLAGKNEMMFNIFKLIYKKHNNCFLYRVMKRKMATQMKMFPRSLEEQTFELPLESKKQKIYIKEILHRLGKAKSDFFRLPGPTNKGLLYDSQVKNYKMLIGKEIFRMIKNVEDKKDFALLGKHRLRIVNMVIESFSEKNYDIIHTKDFRYLLINPDFLPHAHIFFNKNFFKMNPYLIGNFDSDEILKAYLKNPEMGKILEFLQYHKRFFTSGFHPSIRSKNDYYQVITNLKNWQDLDYISFFYHSARIYQIDQHFFPKLNLATWNQAFTHIYWGGSHSSEEKEIFHNHLHQLLFQKYKISSNDKLTIFLIDLIMNCKTYSESQVAFALTVMILARLEENSKNLNDLFKYFISTLSQDSFDFYIKENLVEILKSSPNHNVFNCLKDALSNYESNANRDEIILKKNLSFFEMKFHETDPKNGEKLDIFIGYNHKYEKKMNQLQIHPDSFNVLASNLKLKNTYDFSLKTDEKNDIASKFFINRNYDVFIYNIKKNFLEVLNDAQLTQYPEEAVPSTYTELHGKFEKMVKNGWQNQSNPNSNLNDMKKALQMMYNFIKPYRESLSDLHEKTSFDRRFDRFVLHSNDELKKFAEARENWVYGVIDENMVRKGLIKRGFHVARKFGKMYVARVTDKNRLVPTNIPLSYYRSVLYPSVRKQDEKIRIRKRKELLATIGTQKKKKISRKKSLKTRRFQTMKKLTFKVEREKKAKIQKENKGKLEKNNKVKLEIKPKAGFSTMKQVNDIDEDYDNEVQKNDMESGFKVYLQKLKEIEEKKKKEDEAQQKEIGVLSDNELNKMKKSLFQEDPLYRSAFIKSEAMSKKREAKPFGQEKLFKKEKRYKNDDNFYERINVQHKRQTKGVFEGMKRPSFDEEGEEIEKGKEIELKLKQRSLSETPYLKFWAEKFSDRSYDLKEILNVVRISLKENENIKKQLLLALSYIDSFGKTQMEGASILEILISEKNIKLDPVDKLKVEFTCQSGPSSKDYNNYLKATNIDYDLPQEAYLNLFKYYFGSINYNRKCFKRTIAHLIRYNIEVSDETVSSCIEVFKKQKLGMTMLEFIHLIIKNKIKISQDSVKELFSHLKDYKGLSEDIESLFRLFLKTYEWDYDLSLIDSYLDLLIFQGRQEIYMGIFEKIKEFLIARKHLKSQNVKPELLLEESKEKPENLQTKEEKVPENQAKSIENTEKKKHEAQETTSSGPKKKEASEAHSFYMDFIEKLNTHQVYKFSKLVFYDFVNNQLEFTLRDYLVGLKTFSDSGEEFLVIYNQFKASPFFNFDETIFSLTIEAINTNPHTLPSLFDELLEEYVYTKKYVLTLQNLNSFITAFGKTQKFFEFTNFLRFLSMNKQELNRTVKITCYKVLGKVTDDMSKPYIKGLIDAIFDENEFEKQDRHRLDTIKRKTEAKKLKREAKKEHQQVPSQETSKNTTVFKPIIRETENIEPSKKEEKKVEIQEKKMDSQEKKVDSKEKTNDSAKGGAKTQVASKGDEPKVKGKKGKNVEKEDTKNEKKKETAEEKNETNEGAPKKIKNSRDIMDRLETLGKSQKTRQKKTVQSRDTWNRINDSIPFTDDEGGQ